MLNISPFATNCNPALSVVRGGRYGQPTFSRRAPRRAALNRPAWLALVRAEWLTGLRALGVIVRRPPLSFRYSSRVLWLPESSQALLLTDGVTPSSLRIAAELHELVGPRPHTGVSPSHSFADVDVRVIFARGATRFAGYRAEDAAIWEALDLQQCGRCTGWFFGTWHGSWRCQVCGAAYRRNLFIECFGGALPVRPRPCADALEFVA